MIKKFEFLETLIPEEIYKSAEWLLESEKLQEKSSGIRNLHLFSYFGESTLEIEIFATTQTIKSYTCECAAFKNKNICEHIAAALLLLRSRHKIKTAKTAHKTKKLPEKLNLEAIFEEISIDDLKAFIKTYAQSNSRFDLALKVNFARRVSVLDNEGKYQILLDRLLLPLKSENSRYSPASLNFYLKHGAELLEQFRDAVSLKYYLEAVTIISLLLRKTAYALTHAKAHHAPLELFLDQLHEEVILLYQLDLAPELKDELSHNLLDIIELSYYPLDNPYLNLVVIIQQNDFAKNIENLNQSLTSRLRFTKKDNDLIALMSQIIINASNKEQSFELIREYLKLHHLQDVFTRIIKAQEYDLAQEFIDYLIQFPYYKTFAFHDIELLVAMYNDNKHKVLELLTSKFLKSKRNSLFEQIIEFDIEYSEPYLRKIYSELHENLAYAQNILTVLSRLNEYELLVDYVVEQELYKYMKPYIRQIETHSPQLIELYVRKYIQKCQEEPSYAYHNNVYLMQHVQSIFNDKLASAQINTIQAFQKELEDQID